MAKQPAFSWKYEHRLTGTETAEIYRWSNRPWMDAFSSGGPKDGRIEDFGQIRRGLNDWTGNYKNSGASVRLSDVDRLHRMMLGDPDRRNMTRRQIALELLSDTARAAGAAPQEVYRGLVTAVNPQQNLRSNVTIEDYIGSVISPLNFNKTINQRVYDRNDFPGMHKDIVGTVCQIPYGEISDEGATDSEGLNAEKGRHKVHWLGYDFSIGYHIFGIAGCAIKSVNQVYASDVSEISTPDRVRQTEDTYGIDFLIPGYEGWPHDDLFVDINGRRYSIMYAAGPRAEAHINGEVSIALNICGIEDEGDGTGAMIEQFFPAVQHLFEQFIAANNGKGYQTGTWSSPPMLSSGYSIVKSSSFAAAQELSRRFMGDDVGYKIVFDLDTAMTVREIIRYAHLSSNGFFGADWAGRFMVKLLDDLVDPDNGMWLRENIEAIEMGPVEVAYNETENSIQYQYGWDNDQDEFSSDIEHIYNQASIDEIGEYPNQGPHGMRMCGHVAMARDVMARRILRLKYPPKYMPVKVNLCGLDVDLGDQVLVTSPSEGLGAGGYDKKPHFLMDHALTPSKAEVDLRAMDLETIEGENTLVVIPEIDDEEIPEYPGYELR